MSKDLVCGMEVEEDRFCGTFEGKRYCFCSLACMEKFEKDPSMYVEGEEEKGRGC